MDVLLTLVGVEDWTGLEMALYEHWSQSCPQIFMPNAEKPWDVNIDENLVGKSHFFALGLATIVYTVINILRVRDWGARNFSPGFWRGCAFAYAN